MSGLGTSRQERAMATPPGVRVLWSDFAAEPVTDAIPEHELRRALEAAQIISENELANPEAEAADPLPGLRHYWRYRLTLWRNVAGVPWLLLRQEQLDGEKIKVLVCADLPAAIAAFEQELARRAQSGGQHTVMRSVARLAHV